jgi:3-methyladenine DNA glycosylase/8-oxoguanine DNA glycosylase
MAQTIDPAAAVTHLNAADPVMARIIAAAGPPDLRAGTGDPFRALARAIVAQQLSGKAAETIFGRFLGLFELVPGEFPAPAGVLAMGDEKLRSAGLSRQKTAALRDLAAHFAAGELSIGSFEAWSDDEIVTHLTRVRGVGRWTAEMFLIFELRRPDVLPVNDVGINRAIARRYGLEGMPAPADVLRIGAPWRPWASVACWYLWRSEDVNLAF